MTVADWVVVIVATFNVALAVFNVRNALENHRIARRNKQTAMWLATMIEEIVTNRTEGE